MKSMIIGGNLVPPYGINCDAKILDTILRKEMIISVEKKKNNKNQISVIYNKPTWDIIYKGKWINNERMETDMLLLLFRHSVLSNTLETPMESSRQDCWSVLPCPPPGNLPTQGSKPCLCISYTSGDSSLLRQQICYGNINLKKT